MIHVHSAVGSNITVIKIGGGVLKNLQELRRISDRIVKVAEHGIPPVIVVSALYGVTNTLIQFIDRDDREGIAEFLNLTFSKVCNRVDSILESLKPMILDRNLEVTYLRDQILSFGERLTAECLTHMLKYSGSEAIFYDSASVIRTVSGSEIDLPVTEELLEPVIEKIKEGKIVVIPGFYASDQKGNITLLGRGGSDFSAGIIAGLIGADVLEFWKNVDGVMSADPRIVNNAVTLRNISSNMAKEISMLGGRILHPQALKLLDFSKCKVIIKNVRKPYEFGTIVGIGDKGAASIVVKSDLTLVTWNIESTTGLTLMELLSKILGENVNPYSVSATGTTIITIFSTKEFGKIESNLRNVAENCNVRMNIEVPLSMISVISDLPSFEMKKIRAGILSSLYFQNIFEKAVITHNPSLSFGIVVNRVNTSESVKIIHEQVLSAGNS